MTSRELYECLLIARDVESVPEEEREAGCRALCPDFDISLISWEVVVAGYLVRRRVDGLCATWTRDGEKYGLKAEGRDAIARAFLVRSCLSHMFAGNHVSLDSGQASPA